MNALKQRGWLSRRPRKFQQDLLQYGRRIRYSANEFVFHLDDRPAGIYGIASGTFGLLAATELAEPRLGHLLHPGAWFGEGPLLTGARRRLAAQARTAGEVVYVSLSDLNALCATDPAWHRHLATLAHENLTVAAGIIAELQLCGSEARLAAVLLRAAGRTAIETRKELFPVRLSQKELGEMANVSRQVTNSILRRWQDRGWVDVRYGEVVVADVGSLLERTTARD